MNKRKMYYPILLIVMVVFFAFTACDVSTISDKANDSESYVKSDLESIKTLKFSTTPKDVYEVLTARAFEKSSDHLLDTTISVRAYTDDGGKKKYKGTTDLSEFVRWVSTNEEVATTSSKKILGELTLNLEIIGEGETEIYAETIDGNVKTSSFKVICGNIYHKESAAVFNAGKHILPKLKYPIKPDVGGVTNRTSWDNKIKNNSDPWAYNEKDKRICLYPNFDRDKYSDVLVDFADVSEHNATVKGTVRTFTSTGVSLFCNFIIKFKFSEDFKELTIVSEQYDLPEVMRDSLEQ